MIIHSNLLFHNKVFQRVFPTHTHLQSTNSALDQGWSSFQHQQSNPKQSQSLLIPLTSMDLEGCNFVQDCIVIFLHFFFSLFQDSLFLKRYKNPMSKLPGHYRWQCEWGTVFAQKVYSIYYAILNILHWKVFSLPSTWVVQQFTQPIALSLLRFCLHYLYLGIATRTPLHVLHLISIPLKKNILHQSEHFLKVESPIPSHKVLRLLITAAP